MPKPDWSTLKFGSEYLAPIYYDSLLKAYATKDGKEEDLELLASFIDTKPKNPRVLELGCGSGRGTKVIAEHAQYEDLTLTDLSKRMLEFVRSLNIPGNPTLINADHFTYLKETPEKYDLVVSLWSLAHSMFPWYQMHGTKSFSIVEEIITKFLTSNLNQHGRVFIIQTDGASEEQRLIKQSWFLGDEKNKLQTEYYKEFQSPSVFLLNNVFEKLTETKVLDATQTKVDRIPGAEIEYTSVDEALETFMNFHLEGEYNKTPHFEKVYNFLKKEFETIEKQKERISIGTGFWVYKTQKL